MIAYLAQGVGLGFGGAVQPGPFQTYVIAQTLKNGWRRTLITALAPLISDGPIIVLVLLVLNQVPPLMLRLLHIAGGLFLGFLAYTAFRRWRQASPPRQVFDQSSGRGLLGAVIMNFLSPGPYIYWSLVAGPIFLTGWRSAPACGIGFLVGFYGTLVATFAAIVLLFGRARHLGDRATRAMLGVSALAFACFALYQLKLGLLP
jgi:threonine/homoserine/homoserine lactone efflux protein